MYGSVAPWMISLVAGLEGVLKRPGSLEQQFLRRTGGGAQQDVGLHIISSLGYVMKRAAAYVMKRVRHEMRHLVY